MDKEYSMRKQEATGRKALVRYWPMKGDPWQWGHIWLALELLNRGADKVVLMIDDGDPTRKPDLSPLSFRDAMTKELIALMAGYVNIVYYNREHQELLTADGDTVTATLLKENKSILPFIDFEYVAGYDHFAGFLALKKGEWQLDVPSKLMEVITALLDRGVEANLGAIFSYRASDSSDNWEVVQDKEKAYSVITEIGIRDYIARKLRTLVEKNGYSKNVKRTLNEIIARFETKTEQIANGRYIKNGKDQLNEKQKNLIKEWWTRYKEQRDKSEQIKWWLKKLNASLDYGQKPRPSVVQQKILSKLVEKIELEPNRPIEYYLNILRSFAWSESPKFDAIDQRPKNYVPEGLAEATALPFSVSGQPMDASSSRVRKLAALQIVPYFSIQAAIAFNHFNYSGLTGEEVVKRDKQIGAEVLGKYLVDLDMLSNLAYDVSDKKIVEKSEIEKLSKEGKNVVTINSVFESDNESLKKEIIMKHLGNIANMVDVNKLMGYLETRFSQGNKENIVKLYFSDRQAFEKEVGEVKKLLQNAYGTALHSLDGYLRNYLSEDVMFNSVIGLVKGNNIQEKTFNLIKLINSNLRAKLTEERTNEIIRQQRQVPEEDNVPALINEIRSRHLGSDFPNQQQKLILQAI